MRVIVLAAASLMALSSAAFAQGQGLGPTQNRSGVGDVDTPTQPANGGPAGSVNATSGPQAHPAYPSGSSTPNPGAALVRAGSPKPATGPASQPSGSLKTVTIGRDGAATSRPNSPGVGQPARPPQ